MLKRLAYVLSSFICYMLSSIIGIIGALLIPITIVISVVCYVVCGELNREGFIDDWTMVVIAPVVLPFEFGSRLIIKIENKLFNNEK